MWLAQGDALTTLLALVELHNCETPEKNVVHAWLNSRSHFETLKSQYVRCTSSASNSLLVVVVYLYVPPARRLERPCTWVSFSNVLRLNPLCVLRRHYTKQWSLCRWHIPRFRWQRCEHQWGWLHLCSRGWWMYWELLCESLVNKTLHANAGGLAILQAYQVMTAFLEQNCCLARCTSYLVWDITIDTCCICRWHQAVQFWGWARKLLLAASHLPQYPLLLCLDWQSWQ